MGIISNKRSGYIQSVDRALSILEAFAPGQWLGVRELGSLVGLPKSTTYGLLITLTKRGYLVQNPENGKYKLGLKLFELGNRFIDGLDVRQEALPFLKQLNESFQETVHLVTLDADEVVYIDKVEGPRSIRMSSRVGQRNPLYCTAVGKVLMANMPESLVLNIINKGLKEYTPFTITDPHKLLAHLKTVRQQGYALDDQELEIGLRCVAAPIMDHLGNAVLALSVSAPVDRLGEAKLQEVINSLKNVAAIISTRLGHLGPII
ncbi:MAG: IclR family transcriptional regulator [Bacillota bacterium]